MTTSSRNMFAMVALLGWMLAACSASSDSGGNTGGGAGSAGGPSGGSGGGSSSNTCTSTEISVVESCMPIYQQQAYPACSAIAACAKNEARSSITDGCYICLANVASTCDTSSGTVACPCCVP